MRRVVSFSASVEGGGEIASVIYKARGVKGAVIERVVFYGDPDAEGYLFTKIKIGKVASIPAEGEFAVSFTPISVNVEESVATDVEVVVKAWNEDAEASHRLHMILEVDEG